MGEIINYIFGGLNHCTNKIESIDKTLKKQMRFNRAVVAFAIVTATYAVVSTQDNMRLRKEVKKLRKGYDDEGE